MGTKIVFLRVGNTDTLSWLATSFAITTLKSRFSNVKKPSLGDLKLISGLGHDRSAEKKREKSIISPATLNYYYPFFLFFLMSSYEFENVPSFLGQLFPLHRINESITSDIGANSRLVILLIGSQRQNSFQSFRRYAHSCLYGVQGKSYFGNLFGLEISSHQTFTKHCKQKFKEEKFILQGVQD